METFMTFYNLAVAVALFYLAKMHQKNCEQPKWFVWALRLMASLHLLLFAGRCALIFFAK
jgi:hypothetical protein